MLNALGLIEVIGYVGAIEAADVALKAANVKFIGLEKVGANIVTVKITGDVGAVKAAVEASEQSARKLGVLITSHVIARVHEEVQCIIEDKKVEEVKIEPIIIKEAMEEILVEETTLEEIVEISKEVEVVKEVEIVECEIKETSEVIEEAKKTIEDFPSMKVEELRKLARNLKIPTLTNKQIKFAKKDVLIEELVKFYKESDN